MEEIQKAVLKKNVENIIKKANSGKVLSAREESIVAEWEATKNEAPASGLLKNKVDVCRALNISRVTLDKWISFPDFPGTTANGGYKLDEVIAWIRSKGFKGGESSEMDKLKERQMLLKCENLEFDLQRERKEWIKGDDAVSITARAFSGLKTDLFRLPGILAPQVVGLSVAEAKLRIKDELRSLLSTFATGLWTQPKD